MTFKSSLIGFSADDFPDSYLDGCEKWQQRIGVLSYPVRRWEFEHPVGLIERKTLQTLTAWIGPSDATKVVVLISGTHGVEGFAGTGVQCDLFRRLAKGQVELPEDLAILVIQALNPWGFHFLHRCDHEGIDVNRNFIAFGEDPIDNPGYERLRSLLNVEESRQRHRELLQQRQEMGDREFEIALSGGQFSDPFGPFYGGTKPSFSRQIIEQLIAEYDLASRQLAVIDVHTGLGPYGHGEVISDHPLNSGGHQCALGWYGHACTSPEDGTSSSVPKLGLLDYAWHRIMEPGSCFVTLEYGTLGNQQSFEVLLQDAWTMKHMGQLNEETLAAHAARIRAQFYPDDDYWREAVILKARQVIQQAIDGLMA